MQLPGTECGHARMQSSDDEIQVEEFPPVASTSPHALKGMHPSSSTPALPTHLARESEGSDDNANYTRGMHAACKTSHLVIWVHSGSIAFFLMLFMRSSSQRSVCATQHPAFPSGSRYGFFVSPEHRMLVAIPIWAQQPERLTVRAFLLAGQCVRGSLQNWDFKLRLCCVQIRTRFWRQWAQQIPSISRSAVRMCATTACYTPCCRLPSGPPSRSPVPGGQ